MTGHCCDEDDEAILLMDLVVVVERVAARKSPDMPASGRGLSKGLIAFIGGGAAIIGGTTCSSCWSLIFRYFYKRSLDRVAQVPCSSSMTYLSSRKNI